MTLKNLLIALLASTSILALFGCGESVPTNEEELAKIKELPTNNPDVPTVDAKNEMPIGKRRG
jgi:hypothetical protein